jgi:Flp pilus assembly protein TadD
MLGISNETISYFFSSTAANSQANLDSLAGTILGQGIDWYQKGDYDRALNAFKRSAALSPFSDNSAKAYDYMGLSYLKLEKTEEAIKVYKEAIRLYPSNADLQMSLGDIYLAEERQEEALKAYEAAVQLDPTNAETRYSLGQSLLTAGRFNEARQQFAQAVRLTPLSAAGYYGLGQTARLEGQYQEAALQLNKAIRVNAGFEKAYVELGYTYADMGDFYSASEQVNQLSARESSQAATLQVYINNAREPKMLAAQSPDGFNPALGPATRGASLDESLEAAGSSKIFSMRFSFSKDMDQSSIMDHDNWRISRASLGENRGVYNGGLAPSSAEVAIASKPLWVTYDTETNTATVRFRISQNADGDATIDPAHIVFKFQGMDAYGKAMDAGADEYGGFSRIA